MSIRFWMGVGLLLALAAAMSATFEHRTDIMGGDVEPAALAGVPDRAGSGPVRISGPPGNYAYLCVGDSGGMSRGITAPALITSATSATTFTVASAAGTTPFCTVTRVQP